MATVEYSVEASYADYPFPVIVRKVVQDGEVVSFSLAGYKEAQLAGVDLEQYFTLYKNYIQSHLDSLTALSNELAATQADKHQDFNAAVSSFRGFMREHWAEIGDNDLFA